MPEHVEPDDAFEPTYSPRKIEFWLAHWEELASLVNTPKSSAHIAAHLAEEWMHLQVRLRYCLCQEQHAADTLAVDPACTHERSGGRYQGGPETALCIHADLTAASGRLPARWLATRQIWAQQLTPQPVVMRRLQSAKHEPEPLFARYVAVERMARYLGWTRPQNAEHRVVAA